MSQRSEHTFQFSAGEIAEAARVEAEYHRGRQEWWGRVLETNLTIHYGDPEAWQTAEGKIEGHRLAAERYEVDARVYGSQSRVYDLDAEDVRHFRLGGEPRDEVED